MSTRLGRRRADWLFAPISVAVLLACLFYTLANVFLAPYPGVNLNTGWVVVGIYSNDVHPGEREAEQDGLQVGDQLIAIGSLAYEDYWDDRRRVPFGGYGPGESVPITLRRGGRQQTIYWQMPAITGDNRARRLAGLLFYLPFWLAGTAVLLLLRPRGRRWQLLVSCNYVTAFWLAVGMVSQAQVAASSLVLHAVTWLLVPIYLHLHLLVPRPLLRRRSRCYLLSPLYVIAAILAALEFFQLLPSSTYYLGLLLAMSGSLGLLVFRLFDRSSPSARPATHLMLAGIGLAFGPSFVLGIIPNLLDPFAPRGVEINVAMLAIPLLPLVYTYVIYKRYLGPLEFRANRLLSLYSFTLLYLTAFALAFLVGRQWTSSSDEFIVFILAVSTVFVVTAPALRARFQRLVDRLAYGVKHSPDEILRAFANRIPATLERETLTQLLADEVAPSLLIRQSALYLLADADGEVDLVYARGVGLQETPETPQQVRRLLAEAGQYRLPLAKTPDEHGFDWVRLAIPLKARQRAIGVWLFGRRDPEDYYPQPDITLLTTLTSQAAVAFENTRLFEVVARGKREWEVTFDAITDGIFVADADFRIVRINRALAGWLGTVPQALIGRTCYELLDLSDAPPKTCPCFKAMQSGQSQQVEREVPALKGTFSCSVYPQHDERGAVSALVETLEDITERKRAEKTLRQRNRELALLNRAGQAFSSILDLEQVLITVLEEVRRLLDVTACSVWLIDPASKEPVCQQSTGPQNEIVRGWRLAPGQGLIGWVAQSGESLIVSDAQTDERYFKGVDQCTGMLLRSILGVPLRIKEDVIGVLQVVDTEAARFSATDLTLVESLAASAATAIENARLYETIQQELTERKRTEEELKRRNEELAALNAIAIAASQYVDLKEVLDAALEETLAVLNAEGGLVYLFDESSQTFAPAAHRGLSPDALREVTGPKLGEGLSGRAAQTGELLLVPGLAEDPRDVSAAFVRDGWRSLVSVPLEAKGRTVGGMTIVSRGKGRFTSQDLGLLTAIGRQISMAIENIRLVEEAAEIEILRELDRLRSELIANVSHELRTPLGLIKVFCTTLLGEDVEFDRETQQECLHHIDEETDRLEEIVDNLLDLSHLGDERLRLDKRPTDLGQLTREMVESMEVQLTAHRLVLNFPSEPLMATVDSRRVEQVLRNLLDNAIKYSPEGGTITIQGHEDGWQVLVGVSDEGIGISPQELERVFERFHRVENKVTQSVRGAGLGLAVCRGIVEAHGGRIWAESALGMGSTFYFTLPVSVSSEAPSDWLQQ